MEYNRLGLRGGGGARAASVPSPQPLREDGHGLRGQHEAAPRQGPVAALQEGVAVVAPDEDGGVGLAEPLADQEGAIALQPHHDDGEKLSVVVPAVAVD